ncbi:M15 family metallopeptidase [Caulobacter sp. NIBR2454]|uniref:M15 family metallopeptidase n=1 Tax=Caulobacter sp. NIBR2454 TaxID=3015996 RepID=UPI0022B6F2ED|nr:D-alanyl-D-alanine carboxypeptidase family protein [Caulobacter sp. NIBR2454]
MPTPLPKLRNNKPRILRWFPAALLLAAAGGGAFFAMKVWSPASPSPAAEPGWASPSETVAEGAIAPSPPTLIPASAPNGCRAPAFEAAARENARTLNSLTWSPFGRAENGWAIYETIVAHEIGTACPAGSPGFAQALAEWQKQRRLAGDGRFTTASFDTLKAEMHARRPYVGVRAKGVCPPPPSADRLANATKDEGYGGKEIQLRVGAMAAYRKMVAEAKRDGGVAADPRHLQIFSGYRSPEYDAARCARDNNCDGVVRATCSPHRTGLAMDLYVGGMRPDSTEDANRLIQSRNPAYRWLVANAERFGFRNYPFEPWHWEYVQEAP